MALTKSEENTEPQKRTWKDRLKVIGPGAIVTASFIGPGTVTTATRAGASFGFCIIMGDTFFHYRHNYTTGNDGKTRNHLAQRTW